jgi:hypothetical protein
MAELAFDLATEVRTTDVDEAADAWAASMWRPS